MVPERSAWPVNPAISPRNFMRFVERITDTVVVARAFADHHRPDFVLRIIDERVTDPGAGRERNGVALGKRMKHAVEPDMGLALEFRPNRSPTFLRAMPPNPMTSSGASFEDIAQ